MDVVTFDCDSFTRAEELLAGGKSKVDRPLCNNTWLIRIDQDTIGVRFHSTIVVAYHRDGTETIATGGWWTVTTKARIQRYSHARVGSFRYPGEKYSAGAIFHPSDPLSPPRVQKCRTCHGLKGSPYAVGPGMVQDPSAIGWKMVEREGPSDLRWRNCYRCSGEGTVDYGSNPQPTPWDGSPVRLDETGRFIGDDVPHHAPATITGHMKLTTSPAIGDIVQGGLSAVIPGWSETLNCPEAACVWPRPLHELVVHLNDRHYWTRERIADWLETLDVDIRFGTEVTI